MVIADREDDEEHVAVPRVAAQPTPLPLSERAAHVRHGGVDEAMMAYQPDSPWVEVLGATFGIGAALSYILALATFGLSYLFIRGLGRKL